MAPGVYKSSEFSQPTMRDRLLLNPRFKAEAGPKSKDEKINILELFSHLIGARDSSVDRPSIMSTSIKLDAGKEARAPRMNEPELRLGITIETVDFGIPLGN